ncbi:MAG: ferritin-like domain-containing protein [Candidatus Caenarcaniphilales bacterium]|nr:ferritin-like domain-containing protein [Candidatus Caenarcaniphilales bacterium]
MKALNTQKTVQILNSILEYELAGVVRYTHYSLMVVGPNRIPIVEFLRGQATESLTHAQQVGEILTGLEGHPSLKISPLEETHNHSIKHILTESLAHEEKALVYYKKLLDEVEGASVYLEEFSRSMISQEEAGSIEIKKMLRDFG